MPTQETQPDDQARRCAVLPVAEVIAIVRVGGLGLLLLTLGRGLRQRTVPDPD